MLFIDQTHNQIFFFCSLKFFHQLLFILSLIYIFLVESCVLLIARQNVHFRNFKNVFVDRLLQNAMCRSLGNEGIVRTSNFVNVKSILPRWNKRL